MLLKRVKLVFIKYYPEELKSGMLCYSKLNKSNFTYYYRLSEINDLKNELDIHQPVHPYIIDEYDNFDTDINSLFLFQFNNKSEPVAANFDDLIGHEIEDVKLIVATPDQIAYVEKDNHLSNGIESKKCFDIFDDNRSEFLDRILNNDGSCYILSKDEFTHPEEYTDVSWGDGKTKVILKNNKVIIYP